MRASWGGLIVAAVLLVAGALLTWGWHFSTSTVHDQLAAQKIFFPAQIDAKTYPDLPRASRAGRWSTAGRPRRTPTATSRCA